MTGGNGYRLEAAACELDLVSFATLIRRARDVETSGELAVSSQMYAEALELWRGDPLADTEVLRDHPAVVRLNRQRADAVLGYAQVTAAEGLPDRALPQLQELTVREPLNERAHAQLMIALAASAQQAAALGVYDLVRQRLEEQLGVRPGAELAQAHAQVLSQQIPAAPSTRWPAAAAGADAAPPH
jgi:DNA-binding SARP family transcriptional activator